MGIQVTKIIIILLSLSSVASATLITNDAWVTNLYSDGNYNTNQLIITAAYQFTLIEIPSGRTTDILNLYCISCNGGDLEINNLGMFSENTVTWDTFPEYGSVIIDTNGGEAGYIQLNLSGITGCCIVIQPTQGGQYFEYGSSESDFPPFMTDMSSPPLEGSQTLAFIMFVSTSIAGIFTGLRTVYFWDTGLTLMEIFVSILLLQLIYWYIKRIIQGAEMEKKESMYNIKGDEQESYIAKQDKSEWNRDVSGDGDLNL